MRSLVFVSVWAVACAASADNETCSQSSTLLQVRLSKSEVVSAIDTSPSGRKLGKMGVLCRTACTVKDLEPFAGYASWLYSYSTKVPAADKVAWMNKNHVEFVPMIAWKQVSTGTKENECWLRKDCTLDLDKRLEGCGSPKKCKLKRKQLLAKQRKCLATSICSVDDVVHALQMVKDAFKDSPTPPRFLLGFNEPYDLDDAHKTWEPAKAAEVFRHTIMPAAERVGLALVSPSTKARDYAVKKPFTWFADFIKSCWDMAKADPPCKVDNFVAVAVHTRHCKESYWREYFETGNAPDKHTRSNLRKELRGYVGDGPHAGGEKDWDAYFEARKFWLTETNCNSDSEEWNTYGATGPTATEQCERLTGSGKTPGNKRSLQSAIGLGLVRTVEELDEFDRWAWWPFKAGNDRFMTLASTVMDENSNVQPVGRAILAIGDAIEKGAADTLKLDVDCSGGYPHSPPAGAA
eukprot:CAMPEP_0117469638 /NCGR_PEP_ID=MMETSP0784-20121206/6800_1 /TAXON_ID=39447 /ORGANISM="" /LENGTH=463 /DNA_ID=CAMNT_0005263695 /DNA_START=62 /DNA_END=1453 /DNA_ORIENTATION=-